MPIKLESKLRKQTVFAWLFLLYNIIIFALVAILIIAYTHYIPLNDKYNDDSDGYIIYSTMFFYIVLSILSIIHFIIYIFAIINAVEINGITRNSTLLIIFTVFNIMGIALLIVVSLEKKKIQSGTHNYDNSSYKNIEHSNKIHILKQAFMNNIISSEEYKKKLDELNK